MLSSLLHRKRQVRYRAITLLGLLSLAGCGGSSSSFQQQQVTVSINAIPCSAAPCPIGVGANWQYTATVTGASNQNVTWAATGGGTIDANTGLYIAPNAVPSSPTVTISATSQADTTKVASTTVTVQANDPLGAVTSYTQLQSCAGSLSGGTCYSMAVSCPGAADLSVYLKVNTPSGAPAGTVLFGVGTGGSGLYDDPNSSGYTYGASAVQSVLNAGYNTVQVSFGAPFNSNQPNGWLTGPGGVRRLACRYATVADWVYKNPTIINPNVSVSNSAPMCATGNSGGSAVIAYAAYEYGLDTEFAMIEPTSGPVMSRIDQGCSPCSSSVQGNVCASSSNPPDLCYESADASVIDEAYQSSGATSPTLCTSALNGNPGPDAAQLFLSDSILYLGQSTVSLHNVTVKQLFGDDDTSNAVAQGMTWGNFISPTPPTQCLSGVPHDIPSTSTGATQIANDITSGCH